MTELIWEGKYDDKGRKVAPPRIALPFQTVETVNESAADRDRMQDLFASGRPTDWRNRLIWGDKKYVLPSLLPEFAGKVDLIYIDPPFTTGQDFSFTATIPNPKAADEDEPTTFTKQPSVIEQKAYRDTWGAGNDSYLQIMYERLTLTRELLNDAGTTCGSGTTAAVAEKLNRRWIACDLGRFAIHTTRKRLLGIPGVKPFVVQNLGKYERQAWQVAEFATSRVGADAHVRPAERSSAATVRGENPSQGQVALPADKGSFDSRNRFASESVSSAQDDRLKKDALREQREREAAYRKFILEPCHATPVSGHVWLHGVKAGRMVHVGAVDAPVTRADVNAIAAEVWKAAGKGSNSPQRPAVDILGWEFALEINETAKEIAAQARVEAAFKKIPREVLEKKAVEQGDVHFFELGALSVNAKIKKRELTLAISDFVIPTDDVPQEVRPAIKHWSQMVDYWAVDWDFKDDTFHNQWQSYRTRKNPKLELSTKHEYLDPGKYTVVIKVIDILGNDTTKTLNVDVE